MNMKVLEVQEKYQKLKKTYGNSIQNKQTPSWWHFAPSEGALGGSGAFLAWWYPP